MKIIEIPINDIIIKERKRGLSEDKVKEIADSISEIGLINPITIDRENILVAGFHRYNAFKMLDKSTIPAIIDEEENILIKQLKEIDENLIRYNFHYTEEGDMLLERKRLYEELHPGTKQHIAGGIGKAATIFNIVAEKGFAKDTAKRINKSEQTIYKDIQISKNILDQ